MMIKIILIFYAVSFKYIMHNYYDLFSFGLYFLIKSASFPVLLISFASSIEGKDYKGFLVLFLEQLSKWLLKGIILR